MKFSDYIKFSFFHRLLSASLFGVLIGLFFLLSGFYVTQIKIETSGNNADAYIVKKFSFSPFNKFDLVIKNVKQAKTGTETSSYDERHEIVFEDDNGTKYSLQPPFFLGTSNSGITLINQLNKAIKNGTNNTFTIDNKSHISFGLSIILLSCLLFFFLWKYKPKEKESKQKKTNANNQLLNSNDNKEKSKYKNINNSIIKK
jgi:hypothetical protein